MFKNFKSKLKKRIERWSKKQLVIYQICSWVFILLLVIPTILLMVSSQNSTIYKVTMNIPLVARFLLFIISWLLIWITWDIFWLARAVTYENKLKEDEEYLFMELQKVLSTTEYRKVVYLPKRYWYSSVTYEDDELTYCINLLRNDGIIHYAIIDGDCVRVISKNTAGKQIGHRTISATEFCKKYEVIQE